MRTSTVSLTVMTLRWYGEGFEEDGDAVAELVGFRKGGMWDAYWVERCW